LPFAAAVHRRTNHFAMAVIRPRGSKATDGL
jgi:hypothetical protein